MEALRLSIALVIAGPPGAVEIRKEGGMTVVTAKGVDVVKNPSFVVADIVVEPGLTALTRPSVTVATAGLEENHQLGEDVSWLVAPTIAVTVPVILADVTGDVMRAVYAGTKLAPFMDPRPVQLSNPGPALYAPLLPIVIS